MLTKKINDEQGGVPDGVRDDACGEQPCGGVRDGVSGP
jgi:hypothetical protein